MVAGRGSGALGGSGGWDARESRWSTTLSPPSRLGTIPDPRMERRENRAQEGGSVWLMKVGEVGNPAMTF